MGLFDLDRIQVIAGKLFMGYTRALRDEIRNQLKDKIMTTVVFKLAQNESEIYIVKNALENY